MAAIDVGPGATNRASYFTYGYTVLDASNPADGTGNITSIELWANTNMDGCKVGTFYEDGGAGKYTCRDSVVIGSVTAGSKQTFTTDASSDPIALSVETGDLIGVYWTSGRIEGESSGGDGWHLVGDQMSASETTFTTNAYIVSIYATGTTGGATSIKTVIGVPIADIKAINGVAIADVKSFMGVSNVD